jgi:hypothetical protein
MVFEEIIRHSPRRRALHSVAEGFSPTARAHTGCISQSPSIAERQAGVTSCRCPLKTLHSYLLRQAVETAPERTLRAGRPPLRSPWQRPRQVDARRKAVQRRFQSLNARQSEELPPAVAGSGRRLKPRLSGRFAPGDRLCGRRGSVHAGGRPAKSRPEAISIAERQAVVTSCRRPLRQAVETAPERTLRAGRPPLRSPWQRPRRWTPGEKPSRGDFNR